MVMHVIQQEEKALKFKQTSSSNAVEERRRNKQENKRTR